MNLPSVILEDVDQFIFIYVVSEYLGPVAYNHVQYMLVEWIQAYQRAIIILIHWGLIGCQVRNLSENSELVEWQQQSFIFSALDVKPTDL